MGKYIFNKGYSNCIKDSPNSIIGKITQCKNRQNILINVPPKKIQQGQKKKRFLNCWMAVYNQSKYHFLHNPLKD